MCLDPAGLTLGGTLPAGRTDPQRGGCPKGGSGPSGAPPHKGEVVGLSAVGAGGLGHPHGQGWGQAAPLDPAGGSRSPPAIVDPPRLEQPLKTSAKSPG